jgi:hypothetical protein
MTVIEDAIAVAALVVALVVAHVALIGAPR